MIELFILQSQAAGLTNLLFFAGILLVMYFFFLRPQVKKQKEQASFVSTMAKGDEVVTNSGMIGKINKIESKFIMLQIDQKTFIKIVPHSVSKELTEAYVSGEDTTK